MPDNDEVAIDKGGDTVKRPLPDATEVSVSEPVSEQDNEPAAKKQKTLKAAVTRVPTKDILRDGKPLPTADCRKPRNSSDGRATGFGARVS